MMINLEPKDRFRVIEIIERYTKINKTYEEYLKQVSALQEKLKEQETKLDETKNEEDILMKELHEKYGAFSLMDLNDTLNK